MPTAPMEPGTDRTRTMREAKELLQMGDEEFAALLASGALRTFSGSGGIRTTDNAIREYMAGRRQ